MSGKSIDSRRFGKLLPTLLLAAVPAVAAAQHGHPLVGTWSGERTLEEGRSSRLLLVLNFSEDQVISGFLIENGRRLPLADAELDPERWQVTLAAQREGEPLELHGSITNIGSITERTITGTWLEGGRSSDFRVTMN